MHRSSGTLTSYNHHLLARTSCTVCFVPYFCDMLDRYTHAPRYPKRTPSNCDSRIEIPTHEREAEKNVDTARGTESSYGIVRIRYAYNRAPSVRQPSFLVHTGEGRPRACHARRWMQCM